MKRVERLAWLSVAVVAVNGLVWTSMVGCSGDTTTDDGGPDSSGDTVVPDVTQPDVKNDVATPDGGSDGDAAFDSAPLTDFQQAYAAAFCKRIGTACFQEQLDAGVSDAALGACEQLITTSGGGIENAVYDLADPIALNGGHISINQTSASSCLAGLATMSLPTLSGTEYATLAENCTGALVGDLANGQGCHETAECSTGFCTYDKDAGVPDGSTGVCIPTGVSGASCGSLRGSGNEECMHRGWEGTTQLKCEVYTADGGVGSLTCKTKSADGSYCVYEWECSTDTCDDNYTCNTASTAWTYLYAGQCPTYFPDAGLQ